jgi:multidrug transporter EmrE-like cation transporter
MNLKSKTQSKTVKFLIFYLVLATAIGIEILADIFLKKSISGNLYWFFTGMLLYAFTAFPVVYLFEKSDFEIVFIIWEAFGVVLGLIVATLYFGESFTSHKILALIFAIAALICSYF